MYLQIVVNIPRISGVFDYLAPEPFAQTIKPGCLVEVPFGRQTVQGIVLREVPFPQVPETREILSLLDPEPVVTAQQIELAETLAVQTFSSLAVCLGMMIPPGLRQQADTQYRLSRQGEEALPEAIEKLSPGQRKLISHLRKSKHSQQGLRGRQLEAAFRHEGWRKAMRSLEHSGWVTSFAVLPPPSARPKTVRTVQLSCSQEEIEQIADLGRGDAGERRRAILHFLLKEPWPVEVSWVYAASGGSLSDLRKLADLGLVTLSDKEVWRDPLESIDWIPPEIPQLTSSQQQVWAQVQKAIQKREGVNPFLLHGVTGSGKTEIYLRAVEETLLQGRQAMVLVPEIALTPQTVRRFLSRFPGQVGLLHSALSEGERYDTWRRVRAGLIKVVVGPRSALFAPLADIGLIVVDEFHDDSYYQNDPQPYYHAVTTAIRYGQISKGVVILGSATPPIDLLQRAQRNNWTVLHLPQRILAHRQNVQMQMERLGIHLTDFETDGESTVLPLPPVDIIDMRKELKSGNRSIFSQALQQAVSETLANKQQAILFLNRRGSATYVFCRDCGFSLKCPRCDLPLTFHTTQGEKGILACHTCNYRRGKPDKCPQCGSQRIRQFGTGTERVESELQALYPDARILRWDAGSARGKNAHEILLSHFINHRADILVGTQMLAKGLDLPLVTLVGVILAEVGLNFPDYRAGERTFQLLMQVAGRAGRSPLGGKVILQTFQPEHYVIQAAARHDFEGFYKDELARRKHIGYPPFSQLLRLEFRHLQAELAETSAKNLAAEVRQWLHAGDFRSTEMIGPVPCFFGKIKGYYRWQIILRGPDPAQVIKGRSLGEWRVQINPPNLL